MGADSQPLHRKTLQVQEVSSRCQIRVVLQCNQSLLSIALESRLFAPRRIELCAVGIDEKFCCMSTSFVVAFHAFPRPRSSQMKKNSTSGGATISTSRRDKRTCHPACANGRRHAGTNQSFLGFGFPGARACPISANNGDALTWYS